MEIRVIGGAYVVTSMIEARWAAIASNDNLAGSPLDDMVNVYVDMFGHIIEYTVYHNVSCATYVRRTSSRLLQTQRRVIRCVRLQLVELRIFLPSLHVWKKKGLEPS
jgi:hypothetical protein